MDKISADLLDRIKTAVIKKLREMDCYVDNELPDYIMILVANKRTMSHMQKDLALFLGDQTNGFTAWLFDMVSQLKKSSSSVAPSLKSGKPKEKKVIETVEEDTDVIDYDLADQEGDFLYQDENSSSSKRSEGNQKTEIVAPKEEIAGKEKVNIVTDRKQAAQKSAKVYPVQPVSRLPEESRQPAFLDEYDPTKPEFTSGLSSVVRSMKRGQSKPPITSKLLLRAVDDATKSIIDNKNMNRYKPTPIKVLASTKIENSGARSHNLVNVPITPSLDFDASPVLNVSEASNPDPLEHEYPNEYESESYYGLLENRALLENSLSRTIQSDPSETLLYLNEYSTADDAALQLQEYPEEVSMEDEENPHFIVTLDGVDMPSFKRKFSQDSDESMDAEDSYSEDFESYQKRQKVVERCKYWPSCKNDDCVYHHPSVPCKTFPDCRYGDKCLYVHPNCKFDARCSRKGCPYTHAVKKSFSFKPVPIKRPVPARGFKAVCKFYPKCTVKNCAFIHPKLCRFGTKCRLPTCPFTHVSVPPRDQLKWKANVSDDI